MGEYPRCRRDSWSQHCFIVGCMCVFLPACVSVDVHAKSQRTLLPEWVSLD